ncbi:hypothetical protein BpHYR1_033236 [Brachionus plicatilis]|uniref:Uncharacterized protein n=1 Tax=Brachionus plicatilis TaxID=10195 RepID=A0A3M7RF75_BRAPC|nr:hypothetical protein BpHYR1_033236 [Brachionus plicatilis]
MQILLSTIMLSYKKPRLFIIFLKYYLTFKINHYSVIDTVICFQDNGKKLGRLKCFCEIKQRENYSKIENFDLTKQMHQIKIFFIFFNRIVLLQARNENVFFEAKIKPTNADRKAQSTYFIVVLKFKQ